MDAPGWPLLDACSRGCVISARPDVVSLCGSCGLWSDHRWSLWDRRRSYLPDRKATLSRALLP